MNYLNNRKLTFLKSTLKIFLTMLLVMALGSCASRKNIRFQKKLAKEVNASYFQDHFTGIMIYNPATRDTLYTKNSTKYFTPASNTKIFTLYTALKLLPDTVPSIKFALLNDTLYFEGTGDPSALHPYYKDSTGISFIQGFEHIKYYAGNFQDDLRGPGWAWEDFDSYYSPERSGFPLYGNTIEIQYADSMQVFPSLFKDSVRLQNNPRKRVTDANIFYIDTTRKDTLLIPFKTNARLTTQLLEEATGKKIGLAASMPTIKKQLLYSIATDSISKRMMQESDNFLAEQLLILASSILSDTLTSVTSRNFMLDTYLAELEYAPRWVDGSGLSRYNLFTPESLVFVLNKMFQEVPRDRLFTLFPKGGVSGTLEDWYAGNPHPYIIAKSGTLGNTYCLSGYLLTNSGKTLIFSFMNNHFLIPTGVIKENMQRLLEFIRDTY
jgi:D-alanyl-D-alanine carboxypeptidase/D-alanyl-D-alanine-endopeptidase (penicillin-binding protein 4)